ncbi:MAG: SDR family oxidoreductase [Acidimicrobiales bacterium]|nr:SDR family oxidoreductase [Acidimicrobiales bacterium]MCB1016630.1 SDR family oxidoreductase [Acidimicrobiales bacterium]
MARVVVTGGAGFLGSHLCTLLVERGDEVVAVDDLSSGSTRNLAHLDGRDGFDFVRQDVSRGLPVDGPLDGIVHMASAASVPDYLARPIETLDVGSMGTRHGLELARATGARFVLASTSEVYGDPLEHPQTESYWGNVNPVGPRSVYDEAKRFAEALTMAFHRTHGVSVGIVRTFNTYGPAMRPSDGRVVSNFLVQALRGEPLTVYGDGTQTRSFCYVDDQVRGYASLLDASGFTGPVNIGNPGEFTMLELAEQVVAVTGSSSPVVHEELPQDDPTQRRPDISLARERLGWAPTVALRDGLERTAAWFRECLER